MRLFAASTLCVQLFLGVTSVCAEGLRYAYPFFELGADSTRASLRWGLIDSAGQVLVPATFEEILHTESAFGFPERMAHPQNLVPVKVADKWGYVDRKGTMVIPPTFDEAGAFAEGLASVTRDDMCGYIDSTGALVIPPRFDGCGEFREGLAEARDPERRLSGYLDRNGAWSIAPQFLMASSFHEGLAVVVTGKPEDALEVMGWTGKHYRYIDKTGRFAFKDKFDRAFDFSEGLARVLVNRKFGFIDRTGKVAIKPQFVKADEFSNGLAAVCTSKRFELSNDWGYVDRTGKVVIAPQRRRSTTFREGVAVVEPGESVEEPTGVFTFKDLGDPTYIDSSGKVALTLADAEELSHFEGGLAWVQVRERGWGYIDQTGKFVWGPRKLP